MKLTLSRDRFYSYILTNGTETYHYQKHIIFYRFKFTLKVYAHYRQTQFPLHISQEKDDSRFFFFTGNLNIKIIIIFSFDSHFIMDGEGANFGWIFIMVVQLILLTKGSEFSQDDFKFYEEEKEMYLLSPLQEFTRSRSDIEG